MKNRLHISQQLARHIKPVIHNDATRIQVKTAPTIIAKCTPHIAVAELDIVATKLINWSESFFPLLFVSPKNQKLQFKLIKAKYYVCNFT